MNTILNSPFPVWAIAAVTALGVITRPFRLPEAIWAVLGALTLCFSGRLPWLEALHAVGKGMDVYLFLTGMMLASELARREGLFDYMAVLAAQKADGSATRLFFLLYCVGTVVTILMSNDATAVVLTPAVLAVVRAVRADRPLPYLYVCAFVANAASFVLPISNPANLVIFREHMPTLATWVARFALPSVLSIVVTYMVLRLLQRGSLSQTIDKESEPPKLSTAGRTTGWGIATMAVVMLGASALGFPLGWPTFAAGVAVFVAVCLQKRRVLWDYLTEVSWAVLPLVAGLFVLVEGLQRTGVIDGLARLLGDLSRHSVSHAGWVSGITVALAGNLINNLPAGLIAGSAVAAAHAPDRVANAVLIGIDLGPNLSITGSLATILWLTALRREGVDVGALGFLKLGIAVMLPALAAALGALQLA
ncbi:Arsenical pump membrane protein [Paraburkholderia caffeinitolerans]|uniref:Arsenical pump membrane protein n=1 Tax=Paraburkholderia caffeinitolerans TaxID=1723730 RepID=A0A6J5GRE1_9BURK|nr:arsenic transporter [Paraburkholderia caffeinitolerans]CAB3803777.1 Arsenical pump membrane protein [Paraburkholderia caffeinitolerans]